VARLDQQVAGFRGRTSGAGGAGGLLGGLLGGAQLGAGIALAQQGFELLRGAAAGVGEAVFGMNARLQESTTAFRVFTGSAAAAERIVTELRRNADITPFNTQEVIQAGQALISTAHGSNAALMELVNTAEALAAYRPTQGLEGATLALREALEGNLQSIRERFGITSEAIQRFRDQGLTNLQAIQAAMREVGATSELVEQMGRTFEGRRSTVASFFQEIQQRLGAGIFDRASEGLGHLVNLLDRYGAQLKAFASDLGALFGVVAERIAGLVSGPLRYLLEVFAPGRWQQIEDELSRVPAGLTATAQAAQQAAPAVESVTLQLARVGGAAAGIQLEADRTRRAYDEQIEPLQRQLRLLQESTDLQRVQNDLATNRATTENLRLDREIVALQRAARGQEDPGAAGLTVRQRAIALALQERRLRQEELGLTEQQRPAVQAVQQQLSALQERQRQALKPLEDQLANYRDQAAALKLVKDQADLVKQADQERAQAVRDTGTGDASAAAVADTRTRGEAIATNFLEAYQRWIDAHGGSLWKAINDSYYDWVDHGGREQLAKIGGDIANLIGEAFKATIGKTLFPGGAPQVGGTFDPGAALPRAGGTFDPGAALPRVGFDPSGQQGRSGAPAPPVHVNVDVGGLQVAEEGRQARIDELTDTLGREVATAVVDSLIAAAAGTDPGPNSLVQGAGR